MSKYFKIKLYFEYYTNCNRFSKILLKILEWYFWEVNILYFYSCRLCLGSVHKVRHAIFANFYPLPLSHFVAHPGDPPKVRHTSRTSPDFLVCLVQKIRTKSPCTNSLSIVSGVFVRKDLSGVFGLEGFVRGGFCPFLLLSQYICYNRKLNNTLNFMFNMYDKIFYKRDVTCSWPPSPVTNCHTYSDPLPSSVTYLWTVPHAQGMHEGLLCSSSNRNQ